MYNPSGFSYFSHMFRSKKSLMRMGYSVEYYDSGHSGQRGISFLLNAGILYTWKFHLLSKARTQLCAFVFLISLFLAALGLRCFSAAFSSCTKRWLLFLVVSGCSLWWSTFSRCGAQALDTRVSVVVPCGLGSSCSWDCRAQTQ